MQKKKNNEANDTTRDDELSMYAPQDDKIEDVYAAETKIYRIQKRTPDDAADDTDEEIYTPDEDNETDDPGNQIKQALVLIDPFLERSACANGRITFFHPKSSFYRI